MYKDVDEITTPAELQILLLTGVKSGKSYFFDYDSWFSGVYFEKCPFSSLASTRLSPPAVSFGLNGSSQAGN
jgi:hypothetical protein